MDYYQWLKFQLVWSSFGGDISIFVSHCYLCSPAPCIFFVILFSLLLMIDKWNIVFPINQRELEIWVDKVIVLLFLGIFLYMYILSMLYPWFSSTSSSSFVISVSICNCADCSKNVKRIFFFIHDLNIRNIYLVE